MRRLPRDQSTEVLYLSRGGANQSRRWFRNPTVSSISKITHHLLALLLTEIEGTKDVQLNIGAPHRLPSLSAITHADAELASIRRSTQALTSSRPPQARSIQVLHSRPRLRYVPDTTQVLRATRRASRFPRLRWWSAHQSDGVKYYCIVKELLGEEWLTPELFRLGASSLGKNLLKAIEG